MAYPYPKPRLVKDPAQGHSYAPQRPFNRENYAREILPELIERHVRDAMKIRSDFPAGIPSDSPQSQDTY